MCLCFHGAFDLSTRIAKQSSFMRKEPRQSRSRATVEIIVQAGARVLSDGYAGFTTNKVASLAGVSIGSLYQYFPDKLSLVDAIRLRHLDDCLAVMRSVVADGLCPVEFATRLVKNMVAAHSVNPGLHRVLLDEAPGSAKYSDPASSFEIEYISYYANAVAFYRSRKTQARDHISGRMLSDAIDGVIHNAARRDDVCDDATQSELIKLVSVYLAEGV